MPLRLAKIAAAASIAAYLSVVTLGNLTDYGTNLAFVQHVMAMDTIFPTSTIGYRAITDPMLHHAAYDLIIAVQVVVSLLCWIGGGRLLYHLRADALRFNRAKHVIVAGLALGFFAVPGRVCDDRG